MQIDRAPLIDRTTVKNIGTGNISDEHKKYNRYYRETMIKTGLMPRYVESINTKVAKDKRLNGERFSTNYKTREEFEKDRDIISDMLFNRQVAPEDLVKKVADTVKELDLQLGE